MSDAGRYMLSMVVYALAIGLWTGYAVEEFKRQHYFRFGISLAMAISDILLMAKLIFNQT